MRWLARSLSAIDNEVRLRLGGELAVRWSRLASVEDYRRLVADNLPRERRRRELERALIVEGRDEFTIVGRCWPCQRRVAFIVDYLWGAAPVDGLLTPNWREQLRCPRCNLRNRMRAVLHFLDEVLALPSETVLYATEQTTDLYSCLRSRYPAAVGSEYLGQSIPFGERAPSGIRNESVTRLTFPDGAFEVVLSLDVFEHVPEFGRALAECRRVLSPEGTLVFSVPFDAERRDHLVRAEVDADGTIHHHMPPEYHGDPLSSEGCLAYYTFGWELLEDLRRAGFRDAAAFTFWSRRFGYLGGPLMLFVATGARSR